MDPKPGQRADAVDAAPDPSGRQSQLTYVDISAIKPDPHNPRKHRRRQIDAIAKSIAKLGFNAPILTNQNGQIVAGHARYEAAKVLGLKQLPVIRLDHLKDHEAKAYQLADNKLTDRSDWDEALLGQGLKDLSQIIDFDIGTTGFELPEIDVRIQSLDALSGAGADEFNVSEEAAVSATGDLWLLGRHRLCCGDALDPSAYSALLEHRKASAVFTDPPYNVKIHGHVSGKGQAMHREFAMASGELTDEQFTGLLTNSFEQIRARVISGAVLYVCMDWRHQWEVLAASKKNGFHQLNLSVWVKENGRMGSFYRSRHELILVFKAGNAPHINNVQLGRFGRNRTNVWHYPGAIGFKRGGRTNPLDLHPTVKPVALIADAILDSTNRGDVVLDPFAGVGSTILAAEQTGRQCCAIEIDPKYVDIAIERWQRLTKQQAMNVQGQTFSQIKRDRSAAQ